MSTCEHAIHACYKEFSTLIIHSSSNNEELPFLLFTVNNIIIRSYLKTP